MKPLTRQILMGAGLLALSALFYLIHYLLFRDAHHIFIYLVGDVAFVFVEVLLVTLIIHQLLDERERRNRLEKLNMVIGIFFSEVGTFLLRELSSLDPKREQMEEKLVTEGEHTDESFRKVCEWLEGYDYAIEDTKADWGELKAFLGEKRDFLLRLLENPNILEHESFTETLRAVFHLTEELGARPTLAGLPDSDRRHLTYDAKRIYKVLVEEWLAYMNHLKKNFPYLFSLAVRSNPFDEDASVVVKS